MLSPWCNMPKPTLAQLIDCASRELKMRRQVYPNLRQKAPTSTRRDELLKEHTHEIACMEGILSVLQAMVPQQADLFQ